MNMNNFSAVPEVIMNNFLEREARSLLPDMVRSLPQFEQKYVTFSDGSKVALSTDKNGLKISPHKNTWKRKRATGYLVRVEYFHKGQTLLYHVEPWVNYPSDELIAKLMLLQGVNDATMAG